MSKTAAEHGKEQDFGPLWQLKQNREGKLIALREQIANQEKAMKAVNRLSQEIAEYDTAIARLEAK